MKQNEKIRKLTRMGMMAAVSVVLVYFIHFPLFPAAPFLEYDPADIPVFIITFMYGPLAGVCVSIIASVVQGVTVSAAGGPIGILMHVLATGSFACVAGLIYKRNKTRKGALVALVCGVLTMTTVMVGCNLVLTPIYTGTAVKDVVAMLVPIIIPFNLLKGGINAAATFLLYKIITKVLK